MLGEPPPSLLAGFYYPPHCLDVEVFSLSLSLSLSPNTPKKKKKKKLSFSLSLFWLHTGPTRPPLTPRPTTPNSPFLISFTDFHRSCFLYLIKQKQKSWVGFLFFFFKVIKREKKHTHTQKQCSEFCLLFFFFFSSSSNNCWCWLVQLFFQFLGFWVCDTEDCAHTDIMWERVDIICTVVSTKYRQRNGVWGFVRLWTAVCFRQTLFFTFIFSLMRPFSFFLQP